MKRSIAIRSSFVPGANSGTNDCCVLHKGLAKGCLTNAFEAFSSFATYVDEVVVRRVLHVQNSIFMS